MASLRNYGPDCETIDHDCGAKPLRNSFYGITGLMGDGRRGPWQLRNYGAVGAPGGEGRRGARARSTRCALRPLAIAELRGYGRAIAPRGGEGDIGPFTITDLTGLRKGEAIGVMGYGRARADY